MKDTHLMKTKGILMDPAKAKAINRKADKTILVPAKEPKLFILNEQPIGNRIIIKEDDADTMSASGIFLPNAEKPYTGVIVAVGPDCVQVAFASRVRYHPKAGDSITIDGAKYLAARETDIYTILIK